MTQNKEEIVIAGIVLFLLGILAYFVLIPDGAALSGAPSDALLRLA